MNNDNLLRGNPATQFTSDDNGNGRSAVENGRKSGESRRRKANLRKAMQEALEGKYKGKNGEELTGEEILIKSILANLSDPKGRNWAQAAKIAMLLAGADKSDDEKALIKAEAKIAKQNAEKNDNGGDGVEIVWGKIE